MASSPLQTSELGAAREPAPRPATQNHSVIPRQRAATLEELESRFIDIGAQFQSLVQTAGATLSVQRPAPASWSIAECLKHLNLSTDAYLPIWQQVIANAAPRREAQDIPYHTDFWGRLFAWILEPPARIRSKTPLGFEPQECYEVASVLKGFLDRQGRIIATLRRCRGRAIDTVKIASPVDERIHYSIWSSFLINAAHQRRHLWQAQQTLGKLRKDTSI